MGGLLLYYTLGSDPALWPAGERRERGLITHDKGYYHSYTEGADAPKFSRVWVVVEPCTGGAPEQRKDETLGPQSSLPMEWTSKWSQV